MKTERVALYARVSTSAGQNPEMQLVELREYAARRGWQVVEEYVDHGVSGAKESRPAPNRLMNDAKQRKLDVVAVWKLDRFGRSVKHVVVSLADFEALGIVFVSLKDNLDLSTPSGRNQITEVDDGKIVSYTLCDDILEQLRLQYEHGNRVSLVVSNRAVTLRSILQLFHPYSMTTCVGYSFIQQIRNVISSLGVR
jgi:Resolvase, N terminal domain